MLREFSCLVLAVLLGAPAMADHPPENKVAKSKPDTVLLGDLNR